MKTQAVSGEEALKRFDEAQKQAAEIALRFMLDNVLPDVGLVAAGLVFITGCQVLGIDPRAHFEKVMDVVTEVRL